MASKDGLSLSDILKKINKEQSDDNLTDKKPVITIGVEDLTSYGTLSLGSPGLDFCLYNSTLNERLGLNNIVTGFTVCDIIENHSKFIKYDAKGFSFYANPKKKKEDLVFRYRQGMPIEFISYLKSDESYEKLGIPKTKDKGTKVIVKK